MRPGRWLLLLAAFVAAAGCAPSADELLREGWRLLEAGDPERAGQRAAEVLEDDGESSAALLLAARASAASQQYDEAIARCERVRRDDSRESIAADALCAELLWQHRRQVDTAEALLRHVVARVPEHIEANDRLAHLLSLQTRTYRLIPFQLRMIRHGSLTPVRLYAVAVGDKLYPDEELLRELRAADPDSGGVLLAEAQLALFRHDTTRARELLERSVRVSPVLPAAQVRLGRLLLDQGTSDEFLEWHQALDASSDLEEHPGLWEVRGLRCLRESAFAEAARCFWESLRRDPNSVAANHQLARALVGLGRADDATPFFERARLLEEYRLLIDPARASVAPQELTAGTCWRAAALCQQLGLVWEEYGWASLARDLAPGAAWAVGTIDRLGPRLASLPLVRAAPGMNPAERLDLSDLDLPTFVARRAAPARLPAVASPVSSGSSASVHPRIRFADRAAEVGLDVRYYNGADPHIRGMGRPYDFTGGGVAAFDYDLDGWPDLYFPQGAAVPVGPSSSAHRDRLYRNGRGRYEDVSESAGVLDDRYSQGVSVGDVNCDGFPDVFVANIGADTLLRNNGDGTFTDISHALRGDAERWTTSAAIADLTGDGFPEIYTVNYLDSPDVLTRVCRDETGPRSPCTPRDFDAAQDQLFWNRGDETFDDVTTTSGIEQQDGKGLGIIAADFTGTGRLNVFIANDGTPNFYFENQTASPADPPSFTEQAVLAGLAWNEFGHAQACMGVVAEDLTSDGALDLFVTNFYDEYNTLYVQQAGGLFADESRGAGLVEPSLPWLGFGAQAVDADLDGFHGLVVTNGHIDDYTLSGIAYEMPPQFFRNTGVGRFVELEASGLGPYFEGRHLGRGMARLDANRDGAEDLVVTHLDAPAALLVNETPERGHRLAVRLRGTARSRDAIGVTVTVHCGERRLVRQLVAGDGYESANEPRLVFGLGRDAGPVSLRVRWPSGAEQRFDEVAVDQELLIVEGGADVLPLMR